ncbi:hypothetical protein PFISCL1PPCAC_18414, partial [Pristionchus fissidentatus]
DTNYISSGLACPSGYDIFFDGICSKNLGSNSFTTQKQTCSSVGGRLPIIRSPQDFDQLVQSFPSYYEYWIDLSCDGEKLVWSDGSAATYTNFNGLDFTNAHSIYQCVRVITARNEDKSASARQERKEREVHTTCI